MSDFLIEARHLNFSIPVIKPDDRKLMSNPYRFILDLYMNRSRRGFMDLLTDVSLTIEPGERLGVIGKNGAGKSTLLRVLAKIYTPTSGELTVNGVVKGLFDISLGMNQEATGLENIYIRGLQMGMSFAEIRELMPSILEFSELGDAIEKPLNTYSTGMRLRLAVSISTMTSPDVLLLDEWIGTGDARFRERVKERMNRLVEESKGLVLATHNNALMKTLCNRGVVLDQGRIVYQGDLEDALAFYNEEIVSRG